MGSGGVPVFDRIIHPKGEKMNVKNEIKEPVNELCKTCNCILCGWRFDTDAPLDCEDYNPKDDKPNP